MTTLRHMRIIVPVTPLEITVSPAVAIVPGKVRKAAISLVREVISVRDKAVINHAREAISSDRARRVDTNLVKAKAAISPVRDRAVINHAKEAISSDRARRVDTSLVKAKADTSPVRDRAVTNNPSRSLMASPAVLIRKVPVNIRQTMIRQPSTA